MDTVYLVTGAGGFLGGQIVERLVAQKKRVRALLMPGDSAREHLLYNVELFEGDVRDRASCAEAFDTGGAPLKVVHAAGIVTIASKHDELVREINVGGTANIISLCEEYRVQKLVYISSVHAIPEKPRGEVMSETDTFSPDLVEGLYAKTKAEATALALAAARRGLDVSVVHPSGLCGPGDRGRSYLKQLIIDYVSGGLSAGVEGGYDFADVRDVADGIVSCLEKGRRGECYILSGRYVSVRELLAALSRVTGLRPVKLILPMSLAKLTAPLAEAYYKLLGQPPLYTSYSMFTLSGNALFTHEKAARELGYKTRPLENTLSDAYRWLELNGMLRAKKRPPLAKPRLKKKSRAGT
ncbi:MAG: NAD-dependent epimerase/dehydratase family protein [Oscillospiraceae bacterium]|nr:NAD-dependent epimerase/dehydratase family protein [Oscillospiraceae bacterium]